MSVFLTPDLKPFYGGTYFPPQDYNGRPGFTSLLSNISLGWKNQRAEIMESAEKIQAGVKENLEFQPLSTKGSEDIFNNVDNFF